MPTDTRHGPLIRAVIIGVTGRMGRSLVQAAPLFPQLILTGAIDSPGSLALGRDAGEVAGTGSTPANGAPPTVPWCSAPGP